MGVRQYVGSRYVPIFGRKGESSILWDNSKPYEPLSIVLYQGASYTSKQYVPIGIDIRNEEYWALTGNYNAQVEQYRQEVRTFDGRITANAEAIATETTERESADTTLAQDILTEQQTRATADTALQTAIDNEVQARTDADTSINETLAGEITARTDADTALGNRITEETTARTQADTALDSRVTALENAGSQDVGPALESLRKSERYTKCLVLGDSWCKGFYDGSEHAASALGNLVAKNLGIADDNIINKAVSGTGYLTGATTFNQQLNSCTEAELEGVDLVLIIGGQNDKRETDPGACKNAAATLFNNCTTKLPDADVHVFPVPFAHGRTFGTDTSGSESEREIFGPVGSSGTYSMYVGIREAINNMQHGNRIYMHDGCHRWAWSMGGAFSNDAYHLTAAGYQNWADIAAMCVRGNCDWWPTRVDVWSGFDIAGTTQKNIVYECNGMINAIFIYQVSAVCPMGTPIYLPPWCMSGLTRWIPNISPGNATALSIERGLHQTPQGLKVACTVNFADIPVNGWFMISMCWPAGL